MPAEISHGQGEQLAQLEVISVAPATSILFQVASEGLRTEITLAIIGNHGSGGVEVRLFHDDDGTTYDDSTEIFHQTISQNTANLVFQAQHPGSGIHVKPGGSIGVEAGSANRITVTLYGVTETRAYERIRPR